jgi:hypothetical protein
VSAVMNILGSCVTEVFSYVMAIGRTDFDGDWVSKYFVVRHRTTAWMHACIHTRARARTRTHRHTHTDTHTDRHTHTHKDTQTHTHTKTHRHTHTQTQTHTHTDTDTHRHTHTHTCTYVRTFLCFLILQH